MSSTIVRNLLLVCSIIATNALAAPVLHFSGKQGVPVDIPTYSHSIPSSPAYAISLSFGHDDAQRLWDLMRSNIGSQLAVRIGDKSTMTPVVRDVPAGTNLQLTLSDAKEFEVIKSALDGAK